MTHADSSAGCTEHLLDKQEVRRFESPSAYQFKWAEELHCKTGVYVRRWRAETPFGSVRLHHWLHSDDTRYKHDHPWWFFTVVIKGGYTDLTDDRTDHLKVGSFRFRSAKHKHSVWVDDGGAWSILITGPKVRQWGFWIGKKWKKANKYFLEHGLHICD
jgi:hypothetical protein